MDVIERRCLDDGDDDVKLLSLNKRADSNGKQRIRFPDLSRRRSVCIISESRRAETETCGPPKKFDELTQHSRVRLL